MLWIMGFLSMMERHVILLAPLLVLVSVILTHGGTATARTQRLARKMENPFHALFLFVKLIKDEYTFECSVGISFKLVV